MPSLLVGQLPDEEYLELLPSLEMAEIPIKDIIHRQGEPIELDAAVAEELVAVPGKSLVAAMKDHMQPVALSLRAARRRTSPVPFPPVVSVPPVGCLFRRMKGTPCPKRGLAHHVLHTGGPMAAGSEIILDIWSDYVCPFCYLELPAIEAVQREYGTRLAANWHAFELRPDPVPTLDPDGEYLHTTWNRSVYPMAAERGMALRLPPVQPRSRQAFEAVFFAREQGRFDAMHLALFRAFFEDGRDIGRTDVLAALAGDCGLDGDALLEALAQERYTAAVVDDESQARRLGITGVPLTLVRAAGAPLASAVPVHGAVPVETLRAAVRHVEQLSG
ncbi:DsbA family oxidoreductase [Noviherbaspirillum aerium]|uniref:DsbA family oxidoreductase n=1 Tax=Noviherbaspirillum aerium TaxID=2588497 RepID=UPI001CEFB0A7|nr:DsbA family oxidoreductase [Noviherbaspirillum aerium]